ncbi:MAG TPA: peptidase MA family metallohydrolase [Candidatus Limnocylindrales bacterium]|nr:peptidase MA family metallohydrolase [Candidatus Limnocylindrales bacterium]
MGQVSGRRLFGALAVVALALFGVAPVRAADPVSFGDGTGSSKFGQFIEIEQPVTVSGSVARVEVLVETPGAIGPTVVPLPEGTPSGSSTLDYRLDLSDGHVVPNTQFHVRFRVTTGSGATVVGPPIVYTYADDRFRWKTLEGKVVHVHWVEGDQAFGERALKIGDDAVAETSKLLGVTESDPIDFFIYADQSAFYDALGPATRENVGGQAHPDIRTLFALITPDEIDASWVESVVPHELTHVVFQTAVDNPYHEPPHWLNEGLAVYLSDGYQDSDRQQVEGAAKDGSIIPLDGLAGAFPTTRERFFLAYAESVSAVDRIVQVSDRDALVKLIRSYADGVSDDDAFRAALGKDVAGFEADWLATLGAKAPVKRGPQPAPAGPLPAGWGAPQPDPSFEVVGSLPPVPPSSPTPGRTEPGLAQWLGSISLIGLALIAVIAVMVVRRTRSRELPAGPDAPGDNRLFGRPVSDEIAPADGVRESELWSATGWALPADPAEPQTGDPAAPSPTSDVTEPEPPPHQPAG